MEMISGYKVVSCLRAAAWRRVWLPVAILLIALALTGCAPKMPAPVGLTAAPQSPAVYNTAAPFSVGVIPTKAPPVVIGEELGFRLSANRNGYGHVYLLNASGAVLVLAQNLPMHAGVERLFPGTGETFAFRASPPAGVERLLFLVTRQPFKGFGPGSPSGQPVQLAIRAQAFVEHLNVTTAQLPSQDWALTESRIEIVAAEG